MTPQRSDENRVYLSGRLAEDPVLRYIPATKTPVLRTTLAINIYVKDKQETMFIPIVMLSDLAEESYPLLKKGTPIKIEGRLSTRQWEDTEGKTHKVVEVIVSKLELITV